MQKISNIVDMLLASTTEIQTPQPLPALQNTRPDGIDFCQILAGLTGSEVSSDLCPSTLFTEMELNHAKDLLLQGDASNKHVIPYEIPLSNPARNGMNEGVNALEILGLMTGQSKHPVTFSPFINIEKSIESVPLEGTDDLVLRPGEYDELNIGRLIDSPNADYRGSKLSAQGGNSVFSEMLKAEDLQKLCDGESLTIKLSNTENLKNNLQNIDEITFTKKAELEAQRGLNGSRFEVTFKSANDSSQLQAVLLDGKSNPQIKELEGLIVEHQAKDARLILFVSAQKASNEQIQTSAQSVNYSNFDSFMTENTSARLRQFSLQRGPAGQNEISNLIQNSGHTELKTAVMPGQESNFGQTAGEGRQDLGATLLLKTELSPINTHNFENFSDKLMSSMNPDFQTLDSKTEAVLNDNSNRLQMLTRDVQFKIEQPLNKADLPEGGSFRISLTPESLGKIDVQLDVIQDRMVARMMVESPIAKQVVEANLDNLKETLHQSGIKVENIAVNISSQNDNSSLLNRQNGQYFGERFNNGNYDFEAEDIEAMLEMSEPRNNMNLQGSISIFA